MIVQCKGGAFWRSALLSRRILVPAWINSVKKNTVLHILILSTKRETSHRASRANNPVIARSPKGRRGDPEPSYALWIATPSLRSGSR
jgi:hypothetical protein